MNNPSIDIRRPLTADELADMDEAFGKCDADGNRQIDFAEFARLLDTLGSSSAPAQYRLRFNSIDLNHDGVIDRTEFLNWWRST
jgi:Ca2+-binding EF-hand superfamily protein